MGVCGQGTTCKENEWEEQKCVASPCDDDDWIADEGWHCGGKTVTVENEYPGTGTVSKCKERCDQDAECEAFVFKPTSQECYWKKGVSADTRKPAGDAAWTCYRKEEEAKYVVDEGMHCGGDTLALPGKGYPGSGTAMECEEWCSEEDKCHGFVYKPAEQLCYWKENVSEETLKVAGDPEWNCHRKVGTEAAKVLEITLLHSNRKGKGTGEKRENVGMVECAEACEEAGSEGCKGIAYNHAKRSCIFLKNHQKGKRSEKWSTYKVRMR